MRILKQDELFSLIMSLLPPKPCIIEVGAYVGNHTMKFINYFPDAAIFSFEPVSKIYELLKNNVKIHENIHTYNLAVSNYNGSSPLYIAKNPKKPHKISPASSLLQAQNRLNFSPIIYDKTIMVETITLDSWYKSTFAKAPADGVATPNNTLHISIDLLWIDAQGHEYAILEGAQDILKKITYIHTEVHFNQAYKDQKDYTEVISFLEQHNFIEIARDFDNTIDWFFGNILFKKI